MADNFEGFETQNIAGTTTHFKATAPNVWTNLPAVDGQVIQSVIIQHLGATGTLSVVLNEGTTTEFWLLEPRGILAADVKGSPKHIQIKADIPAGVNYQAIINREEA